MKPIQNWFNIPIYTYELLLYGFSWVVHGFWVLQNHQNGSDELLYIYIIPGVGLSRNMNRHCPLHG